MNERIKRARKAAGMSLREAGEAVGLSHASIKKYEDGDVVPSSGVLIKLAKAFNVSLDFFFRNKNYSLSGVEYRKRRVSAKAISKIEGGVIDLIERRLELESFFPTAPFPSFAAPENIPFVTSLDDVEVVAEILRRDWDLGFDSIPDMVDLLESKGIRVYLLEDNVESKFDGLAASVEGEPVVVVGKGWPGDRQRFTLAHELGHLILHDRFDLSLDEEKVANRFAGAFLLPRSALVSEVGRHRSALEWREISMLKSEYGISMRAITYRFKDLAMISDSEFTSMQKFFSFRGWNRVEPVSYKAESSHFLEKLVFRALAEDYIGESKAAELLNIPLSCFKKLRSMEAIDATACQ